MIGSRHQFGSTERNDARSLVASVAAARKLDSKIDPEKIQTVIEEVFATTAPAANNDDVDGGVVSDGGRPHGIIRADQLQRASFSPPLLVMSPFIAEGVTLLAG